ncbi:hypothetical protein [Streptomyces mobaraensis]|uniref:Uncharacterized protein n=1 Tax=Streptomyces mobaraensis TaxID=35621 RepID=A0A5N5WCW1_STRMB|nr:hypothetical protein [Streptomyces mobaraensis]KAB7850112.1 hypothetical protein FRZ00_05795 [Streptomyces mobaraensis]
MPKRQPTAAQMARLRQAGTGEKYTEALRAVQSSRVDRFRMFDAHGRGWDPITQRAEKQLAHIWPAGPKPHWEEKLGELCWKSLTFWGPPAEAVSVVMKACAEAAVTCQTCPAPGRKRVIWLWEGEYGWVAPWVKTCCDGCYWVPKNLVDEPEYRDLVERYEEPQGGDLGGCCAAIEDVTSDVRAQFVKAGAPALLAKLAGLQSSVWSRSAHYDVFSGHAVVLAVEQACMPLLYRMTVAGQSTEPLLPEPERRKVMQAIDGLRKVLHEVDADERSN